MARRALNLTEKEGLLFKPDSTVCIKLISNHVMFSFIIRLDVSVAEASLGFVVLSGTFSQVIINQTDHYNRNPQSE